MGGKGSGMGISRGDSGFFSAPRACGRNTCICAQKKQRPKSAAQTHVHRFSAKMILVRRNTPDRKAIMKNAQFLSLSRFAAGKNASTLQAYPVNLRAQAVRSQEETLRNTCPRPFRRTKKTTRDHGPSGPCVLRLAGPCPDLMTFGLKPRRNFG